MHRIIDLQGREVDDDRLGDRVGRNPHFDRMAHDVQAATSLDTGADILIDEMHRHVDAKTCPRLQTQKIDVERLILDRIELVVARDNALLGTAQVELEDRGQKMPGVDELVDFTKIEGNGLGSVSAPVDHAWNAAFTANMAGGPLAYPCARCGRDSFCRGHYAYPEDENLNDEAPAPPGVPEGTPGALIAARPHGCNAEAHPFYGGYIQRSSGFARLRHGDQFKERIQPTVSHV